MKFLASWTALLLVVTLPSCNFYRPFDGKNTPEDYIEEALKCLHEGNYDCAISNYQALPAGTQKNEKLCLAYLAKGGFTLNSLVNVVSLNSSKMLGTLASALVPWSQAKQSSVDSAKSMCATYAADASTGKTGQLLEALSLLVHCATHMAKTDLYVGNSNSDTACTTAGNNDGRITQTDIINGTSTYMCSTSVQECNADTVAAFAKYNTLNSGGITGVANALNALPAELQSSASGQAAIDAVRVSISTNAVDP